MPAAGRGPLPVLLLAVLAVFTAQQALAPVLAPLAREIGLPEVALGALMTAAATVFAATSLVWGRAVDRYGQRRVLLTGLGMALAGLGGFAVVAQLAVVEVLAPGPALVLLTAARSLLFGAGIGAVPVAAIALVASTTTGDAARTRGIGQVGAVQGVAIALGPALGGLLGFAGLVGPLWAAPVVVAVALVVVAVALPADRVPAPDLGPAPRARGLKPWDARLWPVLLGGFGLYLALSMILIVLGFLVQDRLALDADTTVTTTGFASFVSGVALVAVQGLLVPRLAWPAARLLRTGAPVAAAGATLLIVAGQLWSIVAALAVLALGMGLAAPGYTSAPTLLVGPREQGAVIGLVQTVTGSTFVLGPLTGTALYGVAPALPLAVGAVACLAATLFVWLHPALRGVPAPARPSAGKPP